MNNNKPAEAKSTRPKRANPLNTLLHSVKEQDESVMNNQESHNDENAHQGLITQEKIMELPHNTDAYNKYVGGSLDAIRDDYEGEKVSYFIENEISGEFFRVRPKLFRRRLQVNTKLNRSHTLHNGAHTFATIWSEIETSLVVMTQGIITGLCWMDAFNLSTSMGSRTIDSGAKSQFICTYSAIADRTRQLLFILFKYPLDFDLISYHFVSQKVFLNLHVL